MNYFKQCTSRKFTRFLFYKCLAQCRKLRFVECRRRKGCSNMWIQFYSTLFCRTILPIWTWRGLLQFSRFVYNYLFTIIVCNYLFSIICLQLPSSNYLFTFIILQLKEILQIVLCFMVWPVHVLRDPGVALPHLWFVFNYLFTFL